MALKALLTNLEQGTQAYPNNNTPSTSGGFNYGKSYSPVFEGVFRQRSFKFGQGTAYDRPGQEFSREPLIGKNIDIPGPDDAPGAGGFLDLISGLTDGFVRGGIVNAISRSAKDVARITKFYLTSRGIGFLAKNVALQLTNPRIPVGNTSLFGVDLDRNRTFNLGLNIIAQAGVNFSGIHFDRAGATPIWPDADKYEKYYGPAGMSPIDRATDGINFGRKDRNQGITLGNRLLTLYDTSILGNGEDTPKEEKGKVGQFFENTGNKIKELTGRGGEELYAYNGGPGSLYGIGKTRILRATNTRTEDLNVDYDFHLISAEDGLGRTTNAEAGYIPFKYRGADSSVDIYSNRLFNTKPLAEYVGMPQSFLDVYGNPDASTNIFSQGIFASTDFARWPEYLKDSANSLGIMLYSSIIKIGVTDPDSSKIRDFRSRKRSQGVYRMVSTNYQQDAIGKKAKFYRESRVNTGNPGQLKQKQGFNYNVYDRRTIDKINALDVIRVKDNNFTDQAFRDLIRFRIEAIDADKPTESDTMVFRAFLDDYSDNYSGNWNAFTYNGRGEELYTYGGFKRDISFSFKIAAQSRHEMMPLYRKLNFLVSQTAPDYKGTRMRGNFVKLTIGSLVDRTPGIITRVGLKWQKDYPWEINIDGPEKGKDKEMQVLPHVLDVSVSFTPVHNFIPKKSITDSPFIFKHERNGNVREEEKWYKKGAAQSLQEATPEGQRNGMGDNLIPLDSVPVESVAANNARKQAEQDAEIKRFQEQEAAAKQAAEDAKEAEERKAREALYPEDDEWDEIEIEEEDDIEPFDTAAIANNNQEFKDKSAAFQKEQNKPTAIEPIPIQKLETGVSMPKYLQKAEMPTNNNQKKFRRGGKMGGPRIKNYE